MRVRLSFINEDGSRSRDIDIPINKVSTAASDYPYYVEVEKAKNSLSFTFEYGSTEPTVKKVQNEMEIIYGKKSGRIYSIHVNDLQHLKERADQLKSLENVLASKSSAPRFMNNVKLGSFVVRESLAEPGALDKLRVAPA